MTVKTGGYQTGMSYQWYRSMGHWPHSAFCMRWSTPINYLTLSVAGAAFGWMLAELLMGAQ